jgi:glycosyltransferase involved in cell wall biosynthesis
MKKPSIFMVVECYYPIDRRVRCEAESMTPHYDVNVLALKKKGEKTFDEVNGVKVIRIPEFSLSWLGKGNFVFQYSYFTLATLITFLITHPLKRYRAVHLNNPPDTLFVVGLIARILGSRYVFDLHDLSGELYMARFSRGKDAIYRALLFLERLSCRFANVVITTNHSYGDLIIERHNIPPDKVHIVRNDPILSDFNPNRENGGNKNPEIIFVGAINPQDGLDILLEVTRDLVYQRGLSDLMLRVVGDGDSLPEMKQLSLEMDLEKNVVFEGFVTDRKKLTGWIENSCLGVEPAPDNAVNGMSTFIKVAEYMAAGLPVVAFDLTETRYTTGGNAMLIKPGDLEGFADAIEKLINDEELRQKLGAIGSLRVKEKFNWQVAADKLNGVYREMLN